MSFEPIAIVGQACVLPGALSPDALWQAVVEGRDLVSRVDPGRWRLSPAQALSDGPAPDRAWSDRGGYVRGFESIFDPQGFALDAGLIARLDPVFRWSMHCAREALRDARFSGDLARVGLVMGNLSFPSAGQSRYAEGVWFGDSALDRPQDADPRERFNSGLPAHLTARALGLGGGAFALDAACASSLYAIKLACDRLQDREIDLALAGAVNRCDDLFIHVGFCALTAMSRTGQTRPFHAQADGLVPGEGAGFVALKRLSDALAAGDRVLGVIRGAGLSNDGRGRGLLVPSEDGQERAIRTAYAGSGLTPADIGLLECHATGTPVGDGAELRSTGRVFKGLSGVPMGSLKSNMGHLITAAGVAGLIKVLGAMKAGVRPPTLHVEQPHPELAKSPFRLLTQAEPWDGPRRAGVSAFGFGGNNAHVLVEAPELAHPTQVFVPRPRPEVAVVALGVVAGGTSDAAGFEAAWMAGGPCRGRRRRWRSACAACARPERPAPGPRPADLALRAAFEAWRAWTWPRAHGRAHRHGLRRRGQPLRRALAHGRVAPRGRGRADGVILELEAAGVLGTMPNIPANRLSSQFDLQGPSFTLSSEELSGLRALSVARRALETGSWTPLWSARSTSRTSRTPRRLVRPGLAAGPGRRRGGADPASGGGRAGRRAAHPGAPGRAGQGARRRSGGLWRRPRGDRALGAGRCGAELPPAGLPGPRRLAQRGRARRASEIRRSAESATSSRSRKTLLRPRAGSPATGGWSATPPRTGPRCAAP
ncbi:MAG: hypothetical protein H6740_17150 [Alphaproteobacteria bacterium]|nr:hypothetical protein [Alphaproteobacteria bacterium]